MLLHLSISARHPDHVAAVLAEILGGTALPFPPFPKCWMAFSEADDGTAIEVYPITHQLMPGPSQVECVVTGPDLTTTFVHVAVTSPLHRDQILAIGQRENWPCRLCNRGPFQCIELWLEGRLLVEVFDAAMARDYRTTMTTASWKAMFGMA
jgi:hypothetical protein